MTEATKPKAAADEFGRKLSRAIDLACSLHARQLRKGTNIPYVAHLVGVCSIVLEQGGTEDEAVAAALHDSIEDQADAFGGANQLREHIRREFGQPVLDIVEGCTDAETIPKPPWQERKEHYIAHLAKASESTLLVSAADKLHNARAILSDVRTSGDDVFSRFKGGKHGTLWYYRALVTAFRARSKLPIIDELDDVVTHLEAAAGRARI